MQLEQNTRHCEPCEYKAWQSPKHFSQPKKLPSLRSLAKQGCSNLLNAESELLRIAIMQIKSEDCYSLLTQTSQWRINNKEIATLRLTATLAMTDIFQAAWNTYLNRHCEPCNARRGNLPKFQAGQLKQNSSYCIKEITTVCWRNNAMTSIEFRQPEQNFKTQDKNCQFFTTINNIYKKHNNNILKLSKTSKFKLTICFFFFASTWILCKTTNIFPNKVLHPN